MDRLRLYADQLAEWQQTLNLVSRNSLAHVWDRHMLDSIQLVRHLPADATSITDIDKSVDILTARALAPLGKLCEMADSLGAQTCLFMKGARWREELTEAEKRWRIKLQTFESLTSPEGRILRITGLKKR